MSLKDFEILYMIGNILFFCLIELGNGSFSKVYKVMRKTDQNFYALKQVDLSELNTKEVQNALMEVRILASINSHYIVAYKEVFYDESSQSLWFAKFFTKLIF